MQRSVTFEEYREAAFHWTREAGWARKLALAAAMAALTGLMAQVRVPLPWSPVPLTGQTLAVLLAGVLLGRWWGGASQVLYVMLGAAGLPWFTGWTGGASAVFGPTGGYLLGFVAAALFIGHATDRVAGARHFAALLGLMLAAEFVLIHGPGLLQLGLWLNLVQGKAVGLGQVLWMGTIPFVAGDVIKAVLAAVIASGVCPRGTDGEARNTEG